MNCVKDYLVNILAAISQLLNAAIGGHPNMTLSARAYCSRGASGWFLAHKIINTLFFWQHDHCRQSWEQDEKFCEALCCHKDTDL
jgi:hypothetical protein